MTKWTGPNMQISQPMPEREGTAAFTLIEVSVAMAIAVLVMAGMFQGYQLASRRAQYASFSLAASAMAMQRMESIIAAQWVVSGTSVTNIFNPALQATEVNALCVPNTSTNLIYGTNIVTLTQVSTNPPYLLVRVDCVWNFMGMGTFTNTVAVMRAPDL
jgi:prepilin-type N-terminal cleavage/methylation domain-containing protein